MPRRLRVPKERASDVNPFVYELLITGQRPPPPTEAASSGAYFECFQLSSERPVYRERLRGIWLELCAELLADWIAERAGSRPAAWWWFDAAEPRARVGGTGTPAHLPECLCGIPTSWFEIDQDDPPRFESQATYLDRHGLLTPAERRVLTARDFAPEILTLAADDDDDRAGGAD